MDGLNFLPNLLQELGGLSLINQGTNMQVEGDQMEAQSAINAGNYASSLAIQGGAISAQAYRDAAKLSATEGAYNIAVAQFNYTRQKAAVSDSIINTFSHNSAVQGASGLGFGSQSYLAVTASIASQNERTLLELHNTETQKEVQLNYQSSLYQARYEDQARAAEYQAQVSSDQAKYQGQVQAQAADYRAEVASYEGTSKMISGAISGIGNLLSD